LADDAGAGKTIMAGLLIRELKLRGLADRVLVICPANLTFQWQRELKEKFEEKFVVLKGDQIREQFGINQWLETPQVITSLDLAKREHILPGLKQVRWDLVIVDEAHRMSWSPPSRKTARYALGELLRDSSDHLLLLTATPHKGDPANFSLFLQLLDEDAYADVKSIREAMEQRRAPFYLRRIKEAMVYFPQRQPDGTWEAKKIFTKRTPKTVDFHIDGAEDELYRAVTAFVKAQSHRAAASGDDPRARAIRFLMALYQRRLASSTYALRRSLENRAKRLGDMLKKAQEIARYAPPDLPDMDELDEMEDYERERLEDMIAAVSLARNPEQVKEEIAELNELVKHAIRVEDANCEAKLSKLHDLLKQEGFFDNPQQRLLLFTEFKDTLDYLVKKLKEWGFSVGTIHGGMHIGSRDDHGTRLYAVPLTLRTFATLPHTFEPTATPPALREYHKQPDWKAQPVAARYPRFSTDRGVADENNLEWITPGHPLFEALRRHAVARSQDALAAGACFYSLEVESAVRVDFYRARIVDGLGHVVHERLFAVELSHESSTRLSGPTLLNNLQPASNPGYPPELAALPESSAWLQENALLPFLEDVRSERMAEVERIAAHIEMSLTELIAKEDAAIGRWEEEAERGVEGAAGNLKQAEDRHSVLLERRESRRREMEHQKSLTLQAVDRLTSIVILPHPDRNRPDIANLRPDPETETIAMRVAMEHERELGRIVQDVSDKNLGYDMTSIDPQSGELRLIEVKGIGASTGTVCLTPNEKRVAEDRPDCYWLYVVSNCESEQPLLNEPIPNPAKMPWIEVKKVDHYYLTLSAISVASTDPRLYPDTRKP
jgi:superfamily II DNA or RNA helicase